MLRFSSCIMQHTKRSIKKIPPIEMQHVKVIYLCLAFYFCIESPVIGLVFHCKHYLIHSYIQSLNPKILKYLKILKFKYLQIQHKACLSPFLVTNWPKRHNFFHENPLTPCPPPGGGEHLGNCWVGMCRPGLQIGTPF